MGHLQAFLESGKFGDFLLGGNKLRADIPKPPPPPPSLKKGVETKPADVSNGLKSSLLDIKNGNGRKAGYKIQKPADKNLIADPNVNTDAPNEAGQNVDAAQNKSVAQILLEKIPGRRQEDSSGSESEDSDEWSGTEDSSGSESVVLRNTKTEHKTPEILTPGDQAVKDIVHYYLDYPQPKTNQCYYQRTTEKINSYLPALNNFLQNMVYPQTAKVITAQGVDNYLMRSIRSTDLEKYKRDPDVILKNILEVGFFHVNQIDELKQNGKLISANGFFVCKAIKDEWLTALITNVEKVLIMNAYSTDTGQRILTIDDVKDKDSFVSIAEKFHGNSQTGKYYSVKKKYNTTLIAQSKIDAFNDLFLDLTEEEKKAFKKPRPPTAVKPKL